MKCPFCNQEHPDDFQFCPRTGMKIEIQNKACTNKACTEFGKYVLPLGAKFCPQCGHPISQTQNRENMPTDKDHVLTFEVNGVSFNMIKVEKGSFMMGATDEQVLAGDNEKPAHKVTIAYDYYIGEFLVTQELWKAVMKNNPSFYGEGGHGFYFEEWERLPVDHVSWYDCQKFITMLNSLCRRQLHGKKFRLPTEAEWEFAARGGNKSKGYLFSGSDNIDDVAWYGVDSIDLTTHPVGEKKPNELGLYDMSGNVSEHTLGRYELEEDWKYRKNEKIWNNEDWIDLESKVHDYYEDCIVRGGGFFAEINECSNTYREECSCDFDFEDMGLRLCLS